MQLDNLDSLEKRATAALANSNIGEQKLKDLDKRLSKASSRKSRLNRQDEFRRHLSRYIRDEYRKYSRDHETAENRSESLCDCEGAPCPLQKGKVPSELQSHATFRVYTPEPREKLIEYANRHTEERVLSEAEEAWADEIADVASEFRAIMRDARGDVEIDGVAL